MRNLYIYLPAIIISCFAALIINSTPHHQAGSPQKDLDQDAISTATAGNSPCNPGSALVPAIPDKSSSEIYLAENDTIKIGYPSLGLSSEKNTFTVNLPEKITENKIAWLEYDLFGLQDYSCAPHSINDNLAVGGYWRLKSGHWAHQYEKIPVRSLKQGKNIIRFTAPTEIDFKYMIKNLSIHIGENIYTSRQLVVNQPTTRYYYQRFGYVQGFVQGYQADEAIISVGGKQIPSFDGAFEYLVQKPESTGEKWTASIMATFPDGETIQSEITFIKSIDCDLLTEANSMSEKQIEHSEANGSFWLHLKGLSLDAPEASIPPNTQITAVTLRSIDFPMMDAGMVNVNENGGGYRCLPHGTKFSKEVLLSMEYDPSRLPSGYTPDDINTYYFDNDKRRWIVLPRDTVDITNHLIISRTSHFTDFINGIIKTPESPLTQAYTPTSIKDIKAANPLEGMSVIEPPTANNTGSAKMTFPLVIPPGRKGIQPQLNLTYTSDGGNGWVGLGWNISLPSISVETRWGVPRYDPQQESETYCLNGEQLATKDAQGFYNKMPHRGDWVNRMGNNVNFYPRVEGAFDSIIRHGSNPKNYWWEVIDRNGVSSYYGKMHDSTKVDPSAMLTDDSGNIAYWALTETRDLFNNTVRYHYTVVLDPGNEGGSNYGKQIYISTINYTGHESDSGLFSVLFERYDTTVYKRNDIMISGKYGFKEVTGELLKKVSILFHGNMVRNYYFAFKQGVFGKTLLCGFYEQEVGDDDAIENITDPRSVCTYLNSAEAQNLIKVHRFDYYSDCYSPYTGYDLYEPQVSINTYNDNLANTGGSSAINQSKTDQWGLGGALTVGFGANPFLKNMTAGGYYNYNATQSKRLNVLMMDINGDGLPDKVFAKDGTMSYRKQYYDISSQQYKFDSTPTAIDGITDFLYQESESDAFGGQATFSVVSASYQHSTSKSTTSVYFSDVNGDGLPDLVQDDKVYFNTLNASGNPQFSLANNDTVYIQGSSCNYTVHNGAVIDTVLSYTAPNKPSMTEPIYIPFDAVRLWVAPYDGIINIDAPITLIQDTSLSRRMSKYVDGIRYTIQHNNTELWADTISKDNYNEKNSNNIALDSIVVNAGDKIFFRLQSRYNRSFDKVIWDPYISYDGCLVEYDANGLDFRRFQASNDFLLDQQRSYGAPVGGTMKVSGRIQIPELSDTVTIKIIQNTTDIYSYTHDGLSAVDDSVDFSFTVDSLDSIYCQIRANTNVDWKSISFQPHMYYISNTAGLPDTNDDGSRNLEYYPVLHRTIFNEPVFISFPYTLDQFNTSTIRPFLDFISDTIDGTVTFVVKSNNTTIVKQFMTVTNGQLNNPSWIDLELRPDQTVYFEFYSVDTSLMYQLTDAHIELDSSSVILPAGAHTVYPTSLLKFGPMYRGWGQFTYNCDTTESNQPTSVAS
jgi:hypothetical protein